MRFYRVNDDIVISDGELRDGEELIPNTSEGAFEKHIPVFTVDGDKVTVRVGSVDHPMLDIHYIMLIVVETASGYQKKNLLPGFDPVAEFTVTEPIVAVYEYCNLHGLWKAVPGGNE